MYYTGKGDDGKTKTLGKNRVPKYHPRIQTLGAIDEANAALGVARSQAQHPGTNELVQAVQRDLYTMMTRVAAAPQNLDQFPPFPEERLTWLEKQIEILEEKTTSPRNFILPGDTPSAAAFALARTVTRRAERHLAQALADDLIQEPILLKYLNRLSSLCFVLELLELNDTPTLAKESS